MKLHSLMGNGQKLDGGAMFGNAPKALWEKWIEPDELNRIPLACRALLARTGTQNILFEAGIGAFMEPKYRERYGIEGGGHRLLQSLAEVGLTHEDIDAVIISHLHFDHTGGLLSAWEEGKEPQLLFPKAKFYASDKAWERATNPHFRDRASFVPQLNQQLLESGRLMLLQRDNSLTFDELTINFFQSNGHTPGMMCADLHWNNQRLVFAADLMPGKNWVHLPITMGYDRYPELLIEEKQNLLASVVEDDAWLFYTHDPHLAASKVEYNEQRKKYAALTGHADLKDIPF